MNKQVFIEECPTTYYISDKGELFNDSTKRYYKGNVVGGYLKYDLRVEGKRFSRQAHRLVAEAFIPNPKNLPYVNHKDGNKLNNSVENLEWVSPSENNFHAYNTGLKTRTNGVENRISLSEAEVIEGEEWKQYESTNYYISNKGRIKNEKTQRLLKGKITNKGYVEWCLSIDGYKTSKAAHRLVYQMFKGELKDGFVINHIDGDKTNNNIENLEQIAPSENIKHSYYSVGHKNVRKVGKFSLEGELLETYPSCAEAARQNKGTYSNLISNVCNGKTNTHAGFIWGYLE